MRKAILLGLMVLMLSVVATVSSGMKLNLVDAPKTGFTDLGDEKLSLKDVSSFSKQYLGKPAKICRNCEMDLNICASRSGSGLDFRYLEGAMPDNLRLFSEETISYINGSVERRWVRWNDVADMKLEKDGCKDVKLTFSMESGESVDIVPVFESKEYSEMAWFFGGESATGGIYYPFDGNVATGNFSSAYPSDISYNCSIVGSITFSNSTDGVYVNDSATYQYGRNDWDGVNDFCSFPSDMPGLTLTDTDSFYVSTWFRWDDTLSTDEGALLWAVGDTSAFIIIALGYPDDSKICSLVRGDGGADEISMCSSTDARDALWHHVALVYNDSSGNIALWIDGVKESETGSLTGWTATMEDSGVMRIGIDSAGGRKYDGQIDEFRWQRTAISPSDIYNLYHVDSISSTIKGEFDLVNVSVIDGYGFEFDYNYTDAVDSLNHSVNGTGAVIDSSGLMTITGLGIGSYNFVMNVTDEYGNRRYDEFLFNVLENTTFVPSCDNGLDDDNDTLTDYPADPGCASALDDDETDPVAPGIGGDVNIIGLNDFLANVMLFVIVVALFTLAIVTRIPALFIAAGLGGMIFGYSLLYLSVPMSILVMVISALSFIVPFTSHD